MLPVRFQLLCLLVLGFALPARGEERFALLIGANAGWANDRPLRYAEADAERMRDVLVELGGFPAERVVLLRNPDTATVREHLARMTQAVKALGEEKQSLFVFYYSGHADELHLHLRGTPLSHAHLYEELRDLPATVRLGVLDACRSGSILSAKGGKPVRSFEVKVMDELRARGLALLTSSGADELSQEASALTGAVFTHHLVSGLRGAADFDGDGAVTLSESYRFASQRTQAETAPTAAPHRPAFLYEMSGQGEPVLTHPGQGAASLVLPPGDGQRYVVVDAHQTRLVAEGRTRSEGPVTLALAPGIYHLTHVKADALAVAPLMLERGARVEAARLAYASRPLEVGLLKGNPEELDEEERREWRRGQALRLLDEGKPQAALEAFAVLLAEEPEDAGARRGRARALVRLADERERENDPAQAQSLLRSALQAEPSLSDDPDFARRYQRLLEKEAAHASAQRARMDLDKDVRRNGFLLHEWGIGFDLASTRGGLVLSGLYFLDERWLAHAGFSLLGLGVDVGARRLVLSLDEAPLQLTPTLGVGAHLSLADLGAPNLLEGGTGTKALLDALGTSRLHVDCTVLVGPGGRSGFYGEIGLGLMAYIRRPEGALGLIPWMSVGTVWLF